jgi:hypothetical protein
MNTNKPVKFGVQIFNYITDIYVCPVKIEGNGGGWRDGTTYSRNNYKSFMETGKFPRSTSWYGVGKAFFENMEDAVEHILAGRQTIGDRPNLVSNETKINAITQCRNIFKKFERMRKAEEMVLEKKKVLAGMKPEYDKAYEAWSIQARKMSEVEKEIDKIREEMLKA